MQQVTVNEFGGIDKLEFEDAPTPMPGDGQVLVKLTSIGMNHADLMARQGFYKLSSGDPPFSPGLEAGGIIEAVGPGVDDGRLGQRVVLTPDAPRVGAGGFGGTYRTHYLCPSEKALLAPAEIPDDQLGALWLPYLTAWGCLVWQQNLQPGQVVAMPAASSSVALAAAQIVKQIGGKAIGLTTSPGKVEQLKAMPSCVYDDIVVTHEKDADGKRTMLPWHRDMRPLTDGKGVDVFFDPVAAGAYLDTEVKCLAQGGTVWIYGLLGKPDTVNVTPLIRKHAAIRGWALSQLVGAGEDVWMPGCSYILKNFADGVFTQELGGHFKLEDVRHAHEEMEKGQHVGKLVLIP